MKRYPFAPLEALIITRADDGSVVGSRLVADTLSRHIRQVYRWREIGVTGDQADELAMRAGFHPFEVWPEIADDQIADVIADCANPECSASFVRFGRKRFCNVKCKRRAWQLSPRGAEVCREHARRYYWKNHQAERERVDAYRRSTAHDQSNAA